jgi:hypothetical protein
MRKCAPISSCQCANLCSAASNLSATSAHAMHPVQICAAHMLACAHSCSACHAASAQLHNQLVSLLARVNLRRIQLSNWQYGTLLTGSTHCAWRNDYPSEPDGGCQAYGCPETDIFNLIVCLFYSFEEDIHERCNAKPGIKVGGVHFRPVLASAMSPHVLALDSCRRRQGCNPAARPDVRRGATMRVAEASFSISEAYSMPTATA